MKETPVHNRNWKRILYEKQPYKDNYVDPTIFFNQLHVEQDLVQIKYITLFTNSAVIAQQFTIIAFFLTIYKYVLKYDGILNQLAQLDICLLLLGFGVRHAYEETSPPVVHSIQTMVMFAVCLRIVAPLLQSLTSSFSEDTVHAMAITFSAAHLVFHDYAIINSNSEVFSGTVSLNAAMFSAIILASRLKRVETVVLFLLLAVILFALFPSTALQVRKQFVGVYLLSACCWWVAESLLLIYLDSTLFVVFELLTLLLWIVGPALYLKMQMYKRALRGPWDIQ